MIIIAKNLQSYNVLNRTNCSDELVFSTCQEQTQMILQDSKEQPSPRGKVVIRVMCQDTTGPFLTKHVWWSQFRSILCNGLEGTDIVKQERTIYFRMTLGTF